MKKGLVEALVAAVALCFVGVAVCGAEEIAVGYVDLQKLGMQSKRAKDGMRRLQELYDQEKTKLEKKMNELRQASDDLQKQGPMLKDEERVKRARDLKVGEMDLNELKAKAEQAVKTADQEWQEVFQRDLKKIIERYRKDKKLTIVLGSMAVLSVDPNLDITDDIVTLYDADTGAGPAPKPTPTPKATTPPPPHKPGPATTKPPVPAPGR